LFSDASVAVLGVLSCSTTVVVPEGQQLEDESHSFGLRLITEWAATTPAAASMSTQRSILNLRPPPEAPLSADSELQHGSVESQLSSSGLFMLSSLTGSPFRIREFRLPDI
jgi:hypothetical protein